MRRMRHGLCMTQQVSSALLFFLSPAGYSVFALVGILFFIVSLSAYVKIVTVLGIVRVGLGVGSIPSTFVTGVIALSLAYFVMYPTLELAAEKFGSEISQGGGEESARVRALAASATIWKDFLAKHAEVTEKERFRALVSELQVAEAKASDQVPGQVETAAGNVNDGVEDSLRILAPAFIVSELKEAFSTGLVLFLPFLVLDLVIANILLAVGLSQVNPSLVSFPFKLLLFVLVDGWTLITGNLILSYANA